MDTHLRTISGKPLRETHGCGQAASTIEHPVTSHLEPSSGQRPIKLPLRTRLGETASSTLLRRRLPVLFVSMWLVMIGGCASMSDTRTPVAASFDELRRGTMMPVQRTVSNFEAPLRCMDGMLETYGAGASILVEDLNDKTQKVPAGTTEMFISAMSQMTRRSRAIRTMAFGLETSNLSSYMLQSNSLASFQPELIPSYAVRGSITQFDDNLAKKTADAGVTLGIANDNFLGIGGSKSTSVNLIAMDLAVIRTSDFSLVPGVNSRNSAAILQEGKGVDAEAAYSKLGVNFMTSLSRSDGKSVAVRNLVELSAIELMGKLNKLPYWRCLDVGSDNPEVTAEIEDWHVAMTGSEKLAFYIRHLTALGLLPANAATDPELFKRAFRGYVETLGLEYSGQFSLEVLRAHLDADQTDMTARVEARMAAIANPSPKLDIALTRGTGANSVAFRMNASSDAEMYCFLLDETGTLLRAFPNRWQPSPALRAGQTIELPLPDSFEIVSDASRMQSLRCYLSSEALTANLPAVLTGPDLSAIASIHDIAALDAAMASSKKVRTRVGIDFSGHKEALTAQRVEY